MIYEDAVFQQVRISLPRLWEFRHNAYSQSQLFSAANPTSERSGVSM
jgi:hypothetical protein